MSRIFVFLAFVFLMAIPTQRSMAGILLADNEVDESYDPFADYSEFDEPSEEEADINFFRNGRFFTIGFLGGYRVVTGGMGQVYRSAPTFGVFLCYFFDLRFAMQISFLTGNHPINVSSGGISATGNADIGALGLALKYYFNTQNVTRGLASLNPYVIGGFSEVWRTSTVTGQESFAKDSAIGVDAGVGIEIPLLRNKMFLGAQAVYEMINFSDSNTQITLNNTQQTGIYPTGSFINLNMVLGVNF